MTKVIDWVESKFADDDNLKVVGRTAENFLVIEDEHGYTFNVAVIGVKGVIKDTDVLPLFEADDSPQLVVNIPSRVLWDGMAIDAIHAQSAAFGTFGDIDRAARTSDAGSFRDKNMVFFINAMQQHSNVMSISYVYDSVFRVDRVSGTSLTIAVIDAYNMSAEDVRNSRTRIGDFDIVVKSTSYGSITPQAEAAAESLGAEALTFKELMQRLAR
ncbi:MULTISPECIES: hypothetical protein [unclassified Alteromonas]|jgi:hypothetical protein|uniref:hypothetical protein n=1 Tax=unclassified Alteromonas TaxID=2614992 RepID=UPI001EF27D4A|nr:MULTISPECIES: hypothetical protein [unclassified Alteromonas]MCG7637726.1 hypothetical protein [Alteromonas sp. CNT1-28]MCG7811787.1 hypothetical protein [Alteromonas sp. MCA-1]